MTMVHSTLYITMHLDNDDTTDEEGKVEMERVGSILSGVASRMKLGHKQGGIRDGNGNTIGRFAIIHE